MPFRRRNRNAFYLSGRGRSYRLKMLIQLYNGICQNCGILTDVSDHWVAFDGSKQPKAKYPTIEHKLPKTHPETNNLENLVLFCYLCNQIGAITNDPRVKNYNITYLIERIKNRVTRQNLN